MKQNWMINLFKCFAVLLIMMIPVLGMAQLDTGDPGCDPLDPGCPIDGGLSALLAIGAGYGIKKVRDARKSMAKKI